MSKFNTKDEIKGKDGRHERVGKLNHNDKIGDGKSKKSSTLLNKKQDSTTIKKFTHVSNENLFSNNYAYSIGVNSNKNYTSNILNHITPEPNNKQDKPNPQKNTQKIQPAVVNKDIMIQENNTTSETNQKNTIIESVINNNNGLMKNMLNKQDKWKRGEDSSLKKQLKRIVKNQKGTNHSRKKFKSKDHKVDKYHSYSLNSNKKTINLNNSSGIIENKQLNTYSLGLDQNFKT